MSASSSTGRRERGSGLRRWVSIALLSFIAATAAGFVTASPAMAHCSGEACNYTDPAGTGCSDSTTTPYIRQLANGGYNVATVHLRYSYSCATVWSRLTNLTSDSVPGYAHPWTNRVGGGPDTFWSGAWCTLESNPWYSSIWSEQINDSGYLAYAWGGVVQLNDFCGSPVWPGNLQSYINTPAY